MSNLPPTARVNVPLVLLLLASTALAADPKVRRDVAYVEPKNPNQVLDAFSPATGTHHPIVFWIHGGGWQKGDKSEVQLKPQLFVDKGFVFVSTNYRLFPEVKVKEMAGDVARAIHWTHDHAAELGGDPNTIFVMGHSAGAQLAALVCTDDSYLKAEGLSLQIIKGCVPVDGDSYDVPLQIATVDQHHADDYRKKFGSDEASQKRLSAITYIEKGKSIPPFLFLHVADHADVKTQAHNMAAKLHDAGISAVVYGAEGKTHNTLNSDIGVEGDKPTMALFYFLDQVLKPFAP